jgi:hypothetical protein
MDLEGGEMYVVISVMIFAIQPTIFPGLLKMKEDYMGEVFGTHEADRRCVLFFVR